MNESRLLPASESRPALQQGAKIVVVGAGVSGLVSAWLLSSRYQVTLIESESRLGGHVHTVQIARGGRTIAIDTGFIVCNDLNYPLFLQMLDKLGVSTQPSTMSFSVRDDHSGLEYSGESRYALFAQWRNIFRPQHYRMITDILRFFKEAPLVFRQAETESESLGGYLERQEYSRVFIDQFILPMGGAIWSTSATEMLSFPVRPFVKFFDNHRMLQVDNRPIWRVVTGGSQTYVNALMQAYSGETIVGDAVRRLRRTEQGVEVTLQSGAQVSGEAVVIACHADQALDVLDDASQSEREILGGIAFQPNAMTLHTDESLLPKNKRARAAWNVLRRREPESKLSVTYDMNRLQSLCEAESYCVSLNCDDLIDQSKVLAREVYFHPVYTASTFAAQARKAEIQGANHTYYTGAYWGFGFHEDGMRSAVEVASRLGVSWT